MFTEIITIITSYLIGSLLFCQYLAKLIKTNLYKVGTKNPGATNLILHNKPLGIIGGFLDILKGAIPTYIAYTLGFNEAIIYATGIAAVLGHIFPIYHKLKGGMGGATTGGVILTILFIYNKLQYAYIIITLGIIKIIITSSIRHYRNKKNKVFEKIKRKKW